MCGIFGYLQFNDNMDDAVKLCQGALRTQEHRGPDSTGLWIDKEAPVILGHNRLAILDCSSAGQQPMVSSSGRFVITFNGEIYNYIELRKELEGYDYAFQSSSDTEVLLTSIEHWGLQEAIERFIGMFAFGLWDKKEKKLFLVRDRLGIKPLYYGKFGKTICFASELKPFHYIFKPTLSLNYEAISVFLKRLYIPAPLSIYNEINKVRPGHIVSFRLSTDNSLSQEETFFWNIHNILPSNKSESSVTDCQEALEHLEFLLKDSVEKRMRADVPYGAFLSGGIDSSVVVSLMQSQSPKPINTFSIGFDDAKFNEAEYAAKIAKYLGTNHYELYVSNHELLDVIPSISKIYDEPFADHSQIPTIVVSKMARQHVTVALSGDGGDELFCGYDRYLECSSYWKKLKFLPYGLRKRIGAMIQWLCTNHAGGRRLRMAKLLMSKNSREFYERKTTVWSAPNKLVNINFELSSTILPTVSESLNPIEEFMLIDAQSYLPDDILTKVDRASMANSLEVRVPIIDHRVVEFAWSLPLELKLFDGVTKWPMRKILSKYLPENMFERSKHGFSVPLASWLKKDLKVWAEDLLYSDSIHDRFQLNYAPIQQMWKQHLTGEYNRSYYLWPALCLSDWLSTYHN